MWRVSRLHVYIQVIALFLAALRHFCHALFPGNHASQTNRISLTQLSEIT